MPISHTVTKEETANINRNIRETIAGISSSFRYLKIFCGQSPEAAELLLPLILYSGLLMLGEKRKRTREICEHCGEIASYEDDGCCKFRKMGGYR